MPWPIKAILIFIAVIGSCSIILLKFSNNQGIDYHL